MGQQKKGANSGKREDNTSSRAGDPVLKLLDEIREQQSPPPNPDVKGAAHDSNTPNKERDGSGSRGK